MQQQQIYCDQIQVQQKEIESLRKEKVSLTEKLNAEKITIFGMFTMSFKVHTFYYLITLCLKFQLL